MPLSRYFAAMGGRLAARCFYPEVEVRMDGSPKRPGDSFTIDWNWTGWVDGFRSMRIALEATRGTRVESGEVESWETSRAFRSVVWQDSGMREQGSVTVRIPEGATRSLDGAEKSYLWLVMIEAEPCWPWLPPLVRGVLLIVAGREER